MNYEMSFPDTAVMANIVDQILDQNQNLHESAVDPVMRTRSATTA
jgi:hypothetical protein